METSANNRIVAWNLNHRVRPRAIPEGVAQAIHELDPDVLVLTEYVDGDGRSAFKARLAQCGLQHVSISPSRAGHNQVLLASKQPHALVPFEIPRGDSHANSNVLAAEIAGSRLQIVGIRVPAYKRAAETRDYWTGLSELLAARARDRLILIGDVNADHAVPRSVGGGFLRALGQAGWHVPEPEGKWSYVSSDGRYRTRIDRAIASASVKIIASRYVAEVGSIRAAGTASDRALSDHAILHVETS